MANRIHDAFDSIRADEQLKETTKQFVKSKSEKKSRFIYRAAFQCAFMFACMVLVLAAGVSGYSWVFAPVSYVSIDVNPSIELALNRLDRVIDTAAFNEEGEEIIKNLSLKGKRYTDAIDAIIEDPVMQAYLAEDSELIFTVAADEGREERIKTGIDTCSGHIGHSNSQSISVGLAVASEAHDSGISLGKYYACLQLMQYDDTITIDECKNMSISKIHGLTKVHEQHEEHDQEETHDQGEAHDQDDAYDQEIQDNGCGQDEDNMQGSGQDEDNMQGSSHDEENMTDSGQEQNKEEVPDDGSGQSGQSSMDEFDSSGHDSHHHADHE